MQTHDRDSHAGCPEQAILDCNQACAHCHVESSPKRTEHMSEQVAERCLELLVNSPSVHTLDLTGGAPEMQPAFRWLVSEARARAPHVLVIIDRCNLTVLSEPGQEDLPDFLVCRSLPSSVEKFTDGFAVVSAPLRRRSTACVW